MLLWENKCGGGGGGGGLQQHSSPYIAILQTIWTQIRQTAFKFASDSIKFTKETQSPTIIHQDYHESNHNKP